MDHPSGEWTSRSIDLRCETVILRLETELWSALDDICDREDTTLEVIIATVADQWPDERLASALWEFAISYYRIRSEPDSAEGEPPGLASQACGSTRLDA